MTAHCSKQCLWMLLPQAALHHTIDSLGSNSMKQMGQSPSTGFRLPLLSWASASAAFTLLRGESR